MTKINAQIVADSISPQGNRLTSLLVTFPRFILAELNTHRMLSKNSASSRAIPFDKMVESVQNNPFVPIAWQTHHSGMQGSEYLTDIEVSELTWLRARDRALEEAKDLYDCGVTKQLANRVLEPYMWHTVLITGCDEGWNNFSDLRCPKYEMPGMLGTHKSWNDVCNAERKYYERATSYAHDYEDSDITRLFYNKGQAEIHMMALAEVIWDAMNESTPKQLHSGQWHIPFKDKIDIAGPFNIYGPPEDIVKISTAMAARTSYTVVGEEKEVDFKNLLNLHDKLIEMRHSSPLEHCARAMSDEEYRTFIKGKCAQDYMEEDHLIASVSSEGWCRNYRGFLQYRYLIEENN